MKHKSKIKMIKDAHGCEDGIKSRHYKQGEIYEVEHHLAHNFVVGEVAEHIEEDKAKQSHENKAKTESDYENKSVKPSKSKGEKS